MKATKERSPLNTGRTTEMNRAKGLRNAANKAQRAALNARKASKSQGIDREPVQREIDAISKR